MATNTLVGTRIREYEIIEEIGKGGMGTVYKARHIYIDKDRAIKVIRSLFAEDPELSDRFIREAKILSGLDHPNLVRLFEFGKLDEHTFFMVLEYVQGESVLQRMARVGKLPIADSIQIVRQAAIGLASAHKKGIIHRDISPDNLMLIKEDSGNEITKVIDFGIAKPLMEGTRQYTADSTFLGKPEYCSPEQTGILEQSSTIDHRSDIYSLAVTLYYMLVGKLPFYSPTPLGYLVKHATEPPRSLLSADESDGIPPAMDRFMTKALSKNRDERHPSMEAFVADLDQISLNETANVQNDFITLFESGKKHYDKQEWQAAIDYWSRASRISPEDENLKQWIGHAESQLNRVIRTVDMSQTPGSTVAAQHPPALPPLPSTFPVRKLLFIAGGVFLIALLSAITFLIRKRPEPKEVSSLQNVEVRGDAKLTPALIEAIEMRDADSVKSLIQKGADVNAKVKDDNPLLIACRQDRSDIVSVLLDAGADTNIVNKNGMTPLKCAVQADHEDNVREFLRAGTNINYQSPIDGNTALLAAVQMRRNEIAALLIPAGALVELRNKNDETPLLLAAAIDNADMISLLAQAKADVNAKDGDGKTPLMRASYFGHSENVEALLKAGANPNAQSDRTRETALFHAAYTGRADILPLLIQAGADINAKSKEGDNPILAAAARDNVKVLQILIDAKADLNATDKMEVTPLMRAAYWGHMDNVIALLKAGVDVNTKGGQDGQTALTNAVLTSRIEIVKLLCQSGADVNLKTKNNDTPLLIASQKDNSEIVRQLIESKADLNARDDQDATPLMRASYWGYSENASALIQAGADVNARSSRTGETALTNATTTSKVEIASLLLKAGADVNIKTKQGDTALQRAKRLSTEAGPALVDLLTKAGARE